MCVPRHAPLLYKKLGLEPSKEGWQKIRELVEGRPGKADGLYPIARRLAKAMRAVEVEQPGKRGGGRTRKPVDSFSQARMDAIKEPQRPWLFE
jgi:hypothetical protein